MKSHDFLQIIILKVFKRDEMRNIAQVLFKFI
jgi:hypothetical protein